MSAIAWKQLRESGPIALAGLAAILAFVLITILANVGTDEFASAHDVALLILGLTANIGFLVVLIVGVGVFDQDLSPNLLTFWRSRPINPSQWYWAKYVTGLIVLAVALLLPVGISGVLSGEIPFQLEHLAIVASVYWAVYALAASTICLIRVTIYAAILSVGTVAMGMVVLWLFWDSTEMEVSKMLTTVCIMSLTMAVLATLVGWWAVRRDIGWKK